MFWKTYPASYVLLLLYYVITDAEKDFCRGILVIGLSRRLHQKFINKNAQSRLTMYFHGVLLTICVVTKVISKATCLLPGKEIS